MLLLQCSLPFVGDGVSCTLDSDGDLYPDVALDSPICSTPEGMQEIYCVQVGFFIISCTIVLDISSH